MDIALILVKDVISLNLFILKINLKKIAFIYACMAEAMILAFEGKTQKDFSVGYKPDLNKVAEIKTLADKHGFEIKFTSFGIPVR